jgi:hypothetical protein
MLKARNAYGCLGDYDKQRDVTERGLRMQEQLYGPLSDLSMGSCNMKGNDEP